ncbi:rwd domain protein [Moniliophthora roreri MCA 2997]|uniref:Rwd domain protein n=1 Tax=Moniliophthora roreri (strain MCA 2997) TaxID=1381753 RepID=V2XWK1_MONRO|nr:rwd domain protein [Moniliophthora roreri MCA 2997]
MASDVLLEEFEVLESIFPTELTKTSDRDIRIEVEPEDTGADAQKLKVALSVHYPDDYPDILPETALTCDEGELDGEEIETLVEEMKKMGEENVGMAMTFTIVSHLRDQLADLLKARATKAKQDELEKERRLLEEEAARTRGTPVTVESFKTWKAKFDAEQAEMKAREDEEKMKGLTAKEREEWKRISIRLTGRQLFERNKNLEEDTLMEEGTVSVDFSQYERRQRDEEQEEEERVTFSDSD